jgi:hypothetical protein
MNSSRSENSPRGKPSIISKDWREDYAALFSMLAEALSEKAKRQLAAEVIFLTHSEELHHVNLRWHPKGGGDTLATRDAGAQDFAGVGR